MFWREAGYFDTSAELKPLLHIWSLGIEEQFYLVWPLLVFVAWKNRAGLGALIALVVVISFSLGAWGVENYPVSTFYLLHARFWELSLGSLLAYVESYKPLLPGRSARARDVASCAGLLLVALAIALLDRDKPFPGWWALLPTVGAVLLISSGKDAWVNRKILANKGFVWIGLISYPLYLWRWPLLSFARIIESEVPARPVRIAAIGAAFLLAWATYRFVEIPIRHPAGGKKNLGRNALVLLALMCATGLAGLWIFEREGFDSRVQEFAQVNRQFKYYPAKNQDLCRAQFPYSPDEHCVGFTPQAPSRPKILIVGDSHSEALSRGMALEAGALFPGFDVLAIGKGGCLPFLQVETFGRAGAAGCPAVMAGILNYAAQNDDVKIVVLNARYAFRVSDGGFGGIEADVKNHIQAPGPRTATADYPQVFEAGLNRTLDYLQRSGKTVYFVHQVPELGFDPRSCEGVRPMQYLARARTPCAIPRDAVDARQKSYRLAANRVLQAFPSVRVFDPLDHIRSSGD